MSSFLLRKDNLSVSNRKLTHESSSPSEITRIIRKVKQGI